MRMQWLILAIFSAVAIGCDAYIYFVTLRRLRSRIPSRIQLWSAIALYLILAVALMLPRDNSQTALLATMWMLYGWVSVYVSKIIFTVGDLIASLPALWHGKRWRGVTRGAIMAAAAAFCVLWWGALHSRLQIQVRQLEVEIPGLPKGMDGTRMVQISDLHVGTFGSDTSFVEELFARIDSLHPDIVVFTGDIVNSRTSEIEPFIPAMSRLKAPMGVYAVLGNHDYGDYSHWPDAEAKRRNMEQLYAAFDSAGWNLLLNRTAAVVGAPGDTLQLIGVENVGDAPFPVYGDLRRAYPGNLSDLRPKVLLTHNPAHWVMDIADNQGINIALTLSGHTHAMQCEVLGLSPAVLRYDTWGGLYTDTSNRHQLYVNIGAGTVGFPARIGAYPEITLLTLRHAPEAGSIR